MAIAFDRSSLRLFGIDLAALAGFVRSGVAELMQWRIFRWLTPRYPICLFHADGSRSFRRGVSAETIPEPGQTRHVAVELDPASVLRRSLLLPHLSQEEFQQAASIDVHRSSPFADDDVVWTFRDDRVDGDRVRLDIVLTSRQIVERTLETRAQLLGGSQPEVWIDGDRPFVLPGYGESAREKRERRDRSVLLLLSGLAVILLALLAATPALQMREVALDATAREARLKEQVKDQVAKRAALEKLLDQVRLLSAARSEQRDAVRLLDEVTRALPDNASLALFELTGGSVRITGQSDNAAQLLETLGKHPAFRDVRAPSGIARARVSGKEHFTIEFSVPPMPEKP